MSKKVFFWGLVAWLSFLYFGFTWTLKPYLAPLPNSHDPRAGVEIRFPVRMAKLENSALGEHSQRLATENTAPPPAFDYADWMWRECRNRACVFTIIYLMIGWTIHWLIGQIQRDKPWLG